MTLTTAAYCRLSLNKGDEPLAIDRQLEDAQRVAARLGLPEPVLYADDSVSAKGVRGPKTAYARLTADVEAGKVGAVIVTDIDRLSRRPVELEWWLAACERYGVRLVDVAGELDTSSAAGQLFLRVRAAVAAHEIAHKSARQKRANLQRIESGRPLGAGRRAWGFEVDGMTLVESEAELVRAAYATVNAGGSTASIARAWNEAGVRTPLGKAWVPAVVSDLLKNPRYAARLVHRGEVRGDVESKAPAVVPLDVWLRTQDVLNDPTRRTTPGPTVRYLLAGHARCGRKGCGGPMVSGTRRADPARRIAAARTLLCGDLRHLERAAEPIEDYVVAETLAFLGSLNAVVPADTDQSATGILRAERAAKASRRLALAADLELSEDVLKARLRALDARIAELDAQLAEAQRGTIVGRFKWRDPEATWAAMSLDERRQTLRAVTSVVVHPLGRGHWRRPVSESVTVEFAPELVALAEMASG